MILQLETTGTPRIANRPSICSTNIANQLHPRLSNLKDHHSCREAVEEEEKVEAKERMPMMTMIRSIGLTRNVINVTRKVIQPCIALKRIRKKTMTTTSCMQVHKCSQECEGTH